ncbi:MAG: D-alanyl-D-alanine carboxypeptidase/D-alanyl-D-alanine-endopeptidase [Burkholderia sp.]|nr:D-alanyl-D-alanine carboxypeptidase/D-alanyl-D-alanine-endopeptidase [Burkholderia sp.]
MILPDSVLTALKRARVPVSSISIIIEKIGDRKPIIEWNADRNMIPGSTIKLITTYSGLSLLGPDFRWKTSVFTDGIVDSYGTLHGNLIIKGTGDPKLVQEELIDLIQSIRKLGIINITKNIVLEKGYFSKSTHELPPFDNNVSAPYNVGPDPLMYSFKTVSFKVTPCSSGTIIISALPKLSNLLIKNNLVEDVSSCDDTDISSAKPKLTLDRNGKLIASFNGNYSLYCGSHTTNIAALDHSEFFARGFLAIWYQLGGSFNGDIIVKSSSKLSPMARLISVHYSPTLHSIINDINKFSNNVMARNLFLTIGTINGHVPATVKQSKHVIYEFIKKGRIKIRDLCIENGSGLSRNERISARSLAEVLQKAKVSPIGQIFEESLPIAGVDGTMKHRFTKADVLGGNVHIKTGTLHDVRAIAGYVMTADKSNYVIVSFINDIHAKIARSVHDELIRWILSLHCRKTN